MERLAEDGRLSREMAECIETEDMMRFLRTKSGSARCHRRQGTENFIARAAFCDQRECIGDLSGRSVRGKDISARGLSTFILKKKTDLSCLIIRRIR